jgi:DNA-binding transcriptional LysR family regulator
MNHLRDMALFVDVVKTMSFTRAAEVLGIPKSSLSRRIAGLEQNIGVRLLNRSTRKIELTEAGAIYFARCKEIVDAARLAHEELKDMVEVPRGHLRVSMAPDFGTMVLAPLIAAFLHRYPDVTLEADLSPRRVDLLSEHFDVAIRIGEQPDSTLTVRRLGSVAAALYAAPAYLAQAGEPGHPAALPGHACIRVPLSAAAARWTLWRGEERAEVTVDGRVAVNNIAMAQRFAVFGLGIGLLDCGMAEEDVLAGRLRRVLPDWTPVPLPVHAFTVTRLLPAKTRALISFLADRMRRPPVEDRPESGVPVA